MHDVIYKECNGCRFALGIKGGKTLIFFGVNPSTATSEKYDQTMKRARNLALARKYDSWIMLNIYPQRATNPNDLDRRCNATFHKKNIETIAGLVENDATVVAAWGTPIVKREYLFHCLGDIATELKDKGITWKCFGVTTEGHPKHLSRLENAAKLVDFEIDDYIKKNLTHTGGKHGNF